jgi:hypothetical protein
MIRTNALTTCRLSQNGSGHATISTAQKADVGIIEVVSFFVEFEAAVPRLTPAFW